MINLSNTSQEFRQMSLQKVKENMLVYLFLYKEYQCKNIGKILAEAKENIAFAKLLEP